MITAKQAEAIRAKAEEDRTEQEKLDLAAYDKAVADLTTEDDTAPMIPKARLDKEIAKRKQLEERLTALEAEQNETKARQAQAEREALKAKEDWKALYEGAQAEVERLKPFETRATQQESSMQAMLDAQLAAIPESRRVLIPESLGVAEKIEYIARAGKLLTAPIAPDLGAGQRGGGETKKVTLTEGEIATAKSFNMTAEEYQALKEKAAPTPAVAK